MKFSYDIPIVNFYSTRRKNGLFRNVKTFLGAKEEPVKFSERPVTIGLEVWYVLNTLFVADGNPKNSLFPNNIFKVNFGRSRLKRGSLLHQEPRVSNCNKCSILSATKKSIILGNNC